jgi:hypothetical protein
MSIDPPAPSADATAAAPKPPSRVKRMIIRYALYAAAAIVVAVGIGVYKHLTGDISTAKVGDCLSIQGSNGDTAKVVSCTSADAGYQVLGAFQGKTEDENNTTSPCDAYAGTTVQFWYGQKGRPGEILCLGQHS